MDSLDATAQAVELDRIKKRVTEALKSTFEQAARDKRTDAEKLAPEIAKALNNLNKVASQSECKTLGTVTSVVVSRRRHGFWVTATTDLGIEIINKRVKRLYGARRLKLFQHDLYNKYIGGSHFDWMFIPIQPVTFIKVDITFPKE